MLFTEKGKKTKGTTLSLQEFHAKVDGNATPSVGQNIVYAPKKLNKPVGAPSWADEVENDGKQIYLVSN